MKIMTAAEMARTEHGEDESVGEVSIERQFHEIATQTQRSHRVDKCRENVISSQEIMRSSLSPERQTDKCDSSVMPPGGSVCISAAVSNASSALTLLVGQQKGHPACKKHAKNIHAMLGPNFKERLKFTLCIKQVITISRPNANKGFISH